jgi:hypothetical protein
LVEKPLFEGLAAPSEMAALIKESFKSSMLNKNLLLL